jgi:hypothetical protein
MNMKASRWFWVGLSLFALSGTAALASDASADRAALAAKAEVRANAKQAGSEPACSCSMMSKPTSGNRSAAEFSDHG